MRADLARWREEGAEPWDLPASACHFALGCHGAEANVDGTSAALEAVSQECEDRCGAGYYDDDSDYTGSSRTTCETCRGHRVVPRMPVVSDEQVAAIAGELVREGFVGTDAHSPASVVRMVVGQLPAAEIPAAPPASEGDGRGLAVGDLVVIAPDSEAFEYGGSAPFGGRVTRVLEDEVNVRFLGPCEADADEKQDGERWVWGWTEWSFSRADVWPMTAEDFSAIQERIVDEIRSAPDNLAAIGVRWVCPRCAREMSGPDESCSGAFTDRDHPSNVRAIRAPSPVEPGDGRRDGARRHGPDHRRAPGPPRQRPGYRALWHRAGRALGAVARRGRRGHRRRGAARRALRRRGGAAGRPRWTCGTTTSRRPRHIRGAERFTPRTSACSNALGGRRRERRNARAPQAGAVSATPSAARSASGPSSSAPRSPARDGATWTCA